MTQQLLSLQEIKSTIDRLAGRIGAVLPTYGYSEDFARPHIEVDDVNYHYVVVEGGKELERFTTNILDDLLYRVFERLTSSLASVHELQIPVEGQDPHRLALDQQVRLLAILSQEWAQRRLEGLEKILEQHPFDDWSAGREWLSTSLKHRGYSPDDAWRMACERYPLPNGYAREHKKGKQSEI